MTDSPVEGTAALRGDALSSAARWPRPEDFARPDASPYASPYASADAGHARRARCDEVRVGREACQVARVLFQRRALGTDDMPAMEALIGRHAAAIGGDPAGPHDIRATGMIPARLRQARFASDLEKHALLNGAARFAPGQLPKSASGRLPVRHAGVNRVNTTLDVLRDAGFPSIRKGANNTDLKPSDGRLEATHTTHVTHIPPALSEEVLP
ncbi:MAG: hypothetical protein AAFR52_14770 [Pseudomonadota bacterium]